MCCKQSEYSATTEINSVKCCVLFCCVCVVKERLSITVQPLESIQIKEGDRLELTIEASGFPYPVYSWFHAKNQLSNSSSGKHVIEDVRLQSINQFM